MVRWCKADWLKIHFSVCSVKKLVMSTKSLRREMSGPLPCTGLQLWDSVIPTDMKCSVHFSFFWYRNVQVTLARRINHHGLCTKTCRCCMARWLAGTKGGMYESPHLLTARSSLQWGRWWRGDMQNYSTRSSHVSNRQARAFKSQRTSLRCILTCLLSFYLRYH